MAKIDNYIPIVGQSVIDDLRSIAGRLEGKTIQHVNSTAVGGGVAEILNRIVPLLRELGIETKWEVIKGGTEFFDVTPTSCQHYQFMLFFATIESCQNFKSCRVKGLSF